MNNFKNLLIALLIGLLALSLFTQPAQSATAKSSPVALTKSDLITIAQSVPYVSLQDQVKLLEYSRCLESANEGKSPTPGSLRFGAKSSVSMVETLSACSMYKP